MTPKEKLTKAKESVGHTLQTLKAAKKFPDNFSTTYILMMKEKLSRDLAWKALLYRLHPELKPKMRGIQMRLKLS